MSNVNIDNDLDNFLADLDKEISGTSEGPASDPAPAVVVESTPAINTEKPAGDPAPQAIAILDSTAPVKRETKAADQADGSALKVYVDAGELKKDVQISITDLDNNLTQHAALYVHYAVQTVDARRQHDRVKNAVDIIEAQLDTLYRNKANDEGKKTTEAQIKNQIAADPRYAAAQAKLVEARGIWKIAEIAENAMLQRKDLLLEVARDRRKEREGQARVMELEAMKKGFVNQAQRELASAE